MMVSNFAERLGHTEAGSKVIEDTDSKEQREKARQGIMRMFACCEEVQREKERSLSRQTTVLDFFQSSSGTRASLPVLLDIVDDDGDDPSTFKGKCLLLQLSSVCQIIYIF
jgi:hypothetical protein